MEDHFEAIRSDICNGLYGSLKQKIRIRVVNQLLGQHFVTALYRPEL